MQELRVCLAALALAAWGLPLATAAALVVRASDKDNKRQLTLSVGDTLEIRLEVQFGTGFSWRIASYDARRLKLLAQEEQHGETEKPGGTEHQLFRFQALAKGDMAVRLEYVQPWDHDAKPERTYALSVRIE